MRRLLQRRSHSPDMFNKLCHGRREHLLFPPNQYATVANFRRQRPQTESIPRNSKIMDQPYAHMIFYHDGTVVVGKVDGRYHMHPAIILPEPVIQFVAYGMAPGNDQRHPHQIGRRYRFFFCQRRVTAHQNAPLFPQRHPHKIKPADLHRFQ